MPPDVLAIGGGVAGPCAVPAAAADRVAFALEPVDDVAELIRHVTRG